MLTIRLRETEIFNPVNDSFETIGGYTLEFEHSLYSMSLWESRWKKPFLSTEKTREETIDYIRCMSLSPIDEIIVRTIISDSSFIKRMTAYIEDPATATVFSGSQQKGPMRKVTTEEFYYLMAVNGIPFECEKWNFNRLLVLLRICAIRSAPSKKMSAKESAERRSALNAKRRREWGTKG